MLTEAVLEDKQYQSDTLVMCFSGNAIPVPYPVFELRRPLARLPVDKIFFKDLNRAFFLKGVPGISRSIPETCDFLAEYLRKGRYKNVITMGLSAGSHAAIMFGVMLNIDRAIAIGPRTRITDKLSLYYPEVTALRARREFDAQYDDLAELLTETRNTSTQVHLFFSTGDQLDVGHAKRLDDFPNVTLHGAALGGHAAAIGTMQRGGVLDPRISDLIPR